MHVHACVCMFMSGCGYGVTVNMQILLMFLIRFIASSPSLAISAHAQLGDIISSDIIDVV